MLKIGVIGAGHLGKIHLSQLKKIEAYSLAGFYDINESVAQAVSAEMQVHAYPTAEELIKNVDVVDVVVPTAAHFEYATAAIKQSKHVFIEKPLAGTLAEAKSLVSLAQEANVWTQVGHVARFNPAFMAAQDKCTNPMFIEGHRLAQFNTPATEVSVVLDLMIHDIDIVLSLVKSEVKKISASGVAVIGDTPDIANARLEFDNGCVANLTAGRISPKNICKMRVFQKDTYISMDMLAHKTDLVRVKDIKDSDVLGNPSLFHTITGTDDRKKNVYVEQLSFPSNNPIRMELSAFADAILNKQPSRVTIEDGARALDIACKVIEKISLLQTA